MYFNPKKDISLSEAAKRRNVTPQGMSFLVNKGIFKKIKKIGWHVFLNEDEVKEYIPNKGGRPKAQ